VELNRYNLPSRKNDYSLTFKNNGQTVFYMPFVHNVDLAIKWASRYAQDKNGRQVSFLYVLVFNRRSRQYLGHISV